MDLYRITTPEEANDYQSVSCFYSRDIYLLAREFGSDYDQRLITSATILVFDNGNDLLVSRRPGRWKDALTAKRASPRLLTIFSVGKVIVKPMAFV